MAKNLIFMRHGDYDLATKALNPNGEDNVKKSSSLIKGFLTNKNYIVYHSPAKRTNQSAHIFNDFMGNSHSILMNEGLEVEPLQLIDDFLYEELRNLDEKIDAAVMMTHMPFMDAQTEIFGWKDFPQRPDYASGYIIEVDRWDDVRTMHLRKHARQIARFTPQKLEIL